MVFKLATMFGNTHKLFINPYLQSDFISCELSFGAVFAKVSIMLCRLSMAVVEFTNSQYCCAVNWEVIILKTDITVLAENSMRYMMTVYSKTRDLHCQLICMLCCPFSI